ncbi:MAG: hypothetical protein IPF83_00805 [Rhodanobacteraceae bacterium]|mgnify:CR=1 FL=1|nr:hypothetical protein [Rhodanobacteraceae bacterium]MBP9153768.1 hypothetical protein [Xanthomonadales bacterium]HQW81056.1 hypothetical protein [Pseudomonadota bacterium]
MSTARGLLSLYITTAVLIAWSALNGQFLSDDLAVMHWLLGWDANGAFWPSILAKFYAGLDVPSHYYRPLALITYALDQRLFGWSPLAWHLTGYAFHIINAVLVAAVMRALGADALRATTAAGLFLCFPLAPEVSIWFSGRYDLLAVTGMLIAVYAHLRAHGFDRWRLLSLCGFALGLAAKEAAMPTPGLLVLASLLRAPSGEGLIERGQRTLRECFPAVLMFFAYLGLRHALFGSALQVYPDADPTTALGFGEIFQRLLTLASIPRLVYADAPMKGLVALAAVVIALMAAAVVARRERLLVSTWLLPVAWTLLSLLSLLPHLSVVYAHGEGSRFYYATAPWLALAMAPAIGLLRMRMQVIASCLLVAAFSYAQTHTLAQWARAGAAMPALMTQLAEATTTLDDDAFALAIVPDHIGPVPFVRNAQGGVAMPPQQETNLLPKLVPVLPEDVSTWPQRIANGDVAAIKQRAVAPRLDALFCFDARSNTLIRATQLPNWREAEAFTAAANHFAATACDLP